MGKPRGERRGLDQAAKSFQKAQRDFEKRVRKLRREAGTEASSDMVRRLRRGVLLALSALLLLLFIVPPFLYPVEGSVTSGMFLRFTPERDSLLNIEMHRGLDIAAPAGAPVSTARSGRVITVGNDPDGYGRFVVVRHILGFTSLYGHLASTSVSEGALVWRGRTIGEVGTTGRTTGPHLHFEVRSYGGTVLPPRLVLIFHSLRRAVLGV